MSSNPQTRMPSARSSKRQATTSGGWQTGDGQVSNQERGEDQSSEAKK